MKFDGLGKTYDLSGCGSTVEMSNKKGRQRRPPSRLRPITHHSSPIAPSMEMLVPRMQGDHRGRACGLVPSHFPRRPILVEQLVHEARHLLDLRLAQVTAQHPGDVLDHALTAKL